MQDRKHPRPARLEIAPHVVQSLCSSTAAGNGTATVGLKDALCPNCAGRTLRAAARLAATEEVARARHRRFEVVVRCTASPCAFVGATGGKFTLSP